MTTSTAARKPRTLTGSDIVADMVSVEAAAACLDDFLRREGDAMSREAVISLLQESVTLLND